MTWDQLCNHPWVTDASPHCMALLRRGRILSVIPLTVGGRRFAVLELTVSSAEALASPVVSSPFGGLSLTSGVWRLRHTLPFDALSYDDLEIVVDNLMAEASRMSQASRMAA